MAIPREKRLYLLAVGLSEEQIDEIERDLELKASRAKTEGLEFKEQSPESWELEDELYTKSIEPAGIFFDEFTSKNEQRRN